jgi:DNA-binding transcriptional LysR family regulator
VNSATGVYICKTDYLSIINRFRNLIFAMHITLRQLQIFRAIALSGSTTAAAKSVPLSQSAASASLNELERTLRAPLFDRVGKRLQLNDNGRALLPMALGVLDGARSLESAFLERSLAPDLQLFASTTIGNYVLPDLLTRFERLTPGSRINLRIGNTQEVVTAVQEFGVDLGLIEGPCHAADVVLMPWLEDELVVVAAPFHPLARAARRKALNIAQLAKARWLLREPGSGTRVAVEQALLNHLPGLASVMTLGSSEAIKNAAAAGLGLSCLSSSVVQDLVSAKRLRVLKTRLPRLTRRFALVHHRRKLLSDSLRRFIAHCESYG